MALGDPNCGTGLSEAALELEGLPDQKRPRLMPRAQHQPEADKYHLCLSDCRQYDRVQFWGITL